ncbi:MAG: Hsp20/alpha crystallin family protein [Acidobacteria bacterium]|jgi:HSP20 family protein|nr:Hsp20/alpha crystallin family protein [Acidobacteriota bacterium]
MTVITRWDPFREFSTLQDRMNRLFQQSYGEGREEALTTSTFAPAVDVYEDEHNVTLKIEVPGIEEKDIDVRIENNTLTVHGERKFEKEEKEENYRRVERQYGSFTRSFTLPQSVDQESVAANYDKGVLKIKLAKKAEAKPKQIKVNVGGEKTLEGKGKAA